MIGYHLEQAAGYLRELGAPVDQIAAAAGRRLGAAGIRAWKRGDATTAVNLLGRATTLLPERDPGRLELMCELGGALLTAGEFSRAETVLTSARDLATAAGDRRLALRAGLELLRLTPSIHPERGTDELHDAAIAAIPMFEDCGDDRALGRAWLNLAAVQGAYRCRCAEAEAAGREAVIHYKRAGWSFAACAGTIASALFDGPTPVSAAIQACTELLAEADLNGRANVLPFLGGLEAMRGDFEQARQRVHQGREIFTELGQALAAEQNCGATASGIELLADNLLGAQEALESSHAALQRQGERSYLATRAAALADVLYRRGLYEEAARRIQTVESAAANDDLFTESLRCGVNAKLAARAEDFEKAERLAHEALAVLAGSDALNLLAARWLDLGEVLGLAGRAAEAGAPIEEALELFERKENDVAAAQARLLLAAMTESP